MRGDGGFSSKHNYQNAQPKLTGHWLCCCCANGPVCRTEEELRIHADSAHDYLARVSPTASIWKSYVTQSWRSTGDPRDSLNVTDSLTIEKERDDPEYKAHQPRFTEVGEQSSEHVREGFGRLSLDQQRLNPLKRDPQHFAQGGDDVTRKRLNKSRGKKPPDNRDQELDHERPSGPEPSHYAEFESSNPDLNTSGTGIPQSIPAHHQTGNAPARARVDKSSGNLQMKQNQHQYSRTDDSYDHTEPEPTLLLQPVTKSISQEQLRVELRSIYSGLVMVENKCKDVDREQTRLAVESNTSCRPVLSPKQWQALIALHKTLLHEFHDFFLASQHPAATPNLTKLAARNSMPARLWQFGIHNFLEVLRYRLPESLDYMLAFIYTAYSMMTLLYETVPAFADTWIECLGDLGRYRMAVEDDDRRDRETWSGVSRYWYKMAADKTPSVGRLAHHLAILSRPFSFEQLNLYLRALTSEIPFESAKTSILTLLNPVLEGKQDINSQSSYVEIVLIKLTAIMFRGERLSFFEDTLHEWKIELIRHIHRSGSEFKSQGVLIMQCTIAALYEFGRSKPSNNPLSLIRRAQDIRRTSVIHENVKERSESIVTTDLTSSPNTSRSSGSPINIELEPLSDQDHQISTQNIMLASSVTFVTFSTVLQFSDDMNVYSAIHEYFVMILEFIHYEEVMKLIESDVPWTQMASFLANIVAQYPTKLDNIGNEFPHGPKEDRPLPEDYVRQGLPYGRNYVTRAYLEEANIDRDEQAIEAPSMAASRKQRIYYLGRRIAFESHYLEYIPTPCSFQATSYAKSLSQRDILRIPEIRDIISDSDSDMSYAPDSEGMRMQTPECPPPLPATLSPQPSVAARSGHMPPQVSIEPPRISPSVPARKSTRPKATQSTVFQARTTPTKKLHSFDHEVEIVGDPESTKDLLAK